MAAATAFLSLIIVVAVLAVTTVVARRAQHDAEQASNQRLALQLRAASADFGDERLPLRALLVHAADQLDPTELSLGEMLATVERERQIAARVDSPGEVGFESTWVDDDVMVAGEGDGHVDVWQMGPSGPDRSSRQTFDVGQTPLAMARERPGGVLAVGVGDGSPDQGAFPGRNGGLYLVDLGEIPMTPRRIPLAGSSPVSALAFSGTMLALGRWDGTIATIDLQDPAAPRLVQETSIPAAPADSDPRCQQATAMSDRKVRSIAVDETGRWLAAGANNCVLAAWELNALDQPPGVLEGHTDKIRAVAFVPSTTTLLSAGDDRTIRRWDVRQPGPTGTILASQADAQRVISLCVSPDAKTVVTAGRDHHVRRWSLADGLLTPDPTVLTAHADTVRGVVCLSSSRFVSVAGDGLVLWDLARPSRVGRTIALSDGPLGSLALRPGPEREVAAAESDDSQGVGVVRIEGSDGTPRRLQLGSTYPLAIAYSSDGAVLAVAGNQPTQTGGLDGVARLYDASTLATTSSVLVTPGSSMRAIAVRDADDFTAGADDGTIQITADGVTHQTKTQTGFAVSAVAYAPNGQVLVGDVAGAMYCYNPQHPDRPLGRLDLTRAVESIAVGADGTVVAGTADGLVGVFPSAFDPRATITSPCDLGSWTKDNIGTTAAVVSSVALGADGQLLLAGTTDGDVELWDVRRRRLLGRLTLAAGPVPAFAGSDASASTVVVGAGNELDVFALDRSSLRDRLCRAAGRQLFPDELSSFLPVHQDAGRCGSVASS